MTILNKSVLMAILTMVPFILFSQQDEFRLNHRSISSNQNIIIDNIRESAVRFDKKQTFHNISILFRSRKNRKKGITIFSQTLTWA